MEKIGEVVTEVDDINQCISIILNTVKGSDPLRPLFGCDAFLFLDKPVNVAIPNIIKAIVEAVGIWEKRAVIRTVQHETAEDGLTFRIGWETQAGQQQTTTVQYG